MKVFIVINLASISIVALGQHEINYRDNPSPQGRADHVIPLPANQALSEGWYRL
jgi:hypothetical protein